MPRNSDVLTKGRLAKILLPTVIMLLIGAVTFIFGMTADSLRSNVDSNVVAIEKNADTISQIEKEQAVQGVKLDFIIQGLEEVKAALRVRSKLPSPPTRNAVELKQAIDSLNHNDTTGN